MIQSAVFEHKVSCFSHQVFGRSQSMPGTEALLTKPVEKQHTDTVVNFLIRIACQVYKPSCPELLLLIEEMQLGNFT